MESLSSKYLKKPAGLGEISFNIRDLTDETVVSSNLEMIFAFCCTCDNFKGKKLKALTLHKGENDTNTDATSSQVHTWLFATVYKDGATETYFSSNKAKQMANERDVTWFFDDFIILDDYQKIEFRITTVEGEVQNNPTSHSNTNRIRSSSINGKNGKIYINGWTTIDQANNINEFTTDFTLIFEDEVNFVHFTDEKLKNHISNNDIHLKEEEKSFLIKEPFSYSPFEDGDVEDNFNSCHGFQLGPKHIKSGLLSQIRIPYKSTSNSEIIGEKYMAVQIFREEDDDTASKNKSLGETYFSTNTHTVVSGVADVYVFNFNNIHIPKSFKYVRFIPTTSTSVAPNGYTVENCAKMALRPIKRNNTTNFDDDGCYVIVGNNNKSNLLTICDLIYDKEKTEEPLKNIVSRTWKVECDESCLVDKTLESLYANLTSKEKIVDVNIILHNTESIYNPKENTTNPFELRTFVFTFNTYVSIDDVKDSIGDVMKKGDIYGYPLIYPIHI